MAGTLTISTLSDGTNSTSSTNCIQGSAKAWVNYNGSSQTIRASYNVSSVTYVGTGEYTINFATAMSDANYGVATAIQGDLNGSMCPISNNANPTASALRIQSRYQGGGLWNSTYVCVSVFR